MNTEPWNLSTDVRVDWTLIGHQLYFFVILISYGVRNGKNHAILSLVVIHAHIRKNTEKYLTLPLFFAFFIRKEEPEA